MGKQDSAACRTTIVVPCFNEASRLDVQAFCEFVQHDSDCRFLLVNDGSTDQTLSVLVGLTRCSPDRFRVLDLTANSGKAEAVRRGVLAAAAEKPEWIGYWDADLATPLSAIADFSRVLDTHADVQLVLGSRVQLLGRSIHRRMIRHYLGRIFATAASIVLRLPVYDTQCGAKLFRATPEMVSLFAEPFRSAWIFDVEILARFLAARRNAWSPVESALYELPLALWEEVGGSKVKPRHFLRAAFELIAIDRDYRARRRSGNSAGSVLPFPRPAHQPLPERKVA